MHPLILAAAAAGGAYLLLKPRLSPGAKATQASLPVGEPVPAPALDVFQKQLVDAMTAKPPYVSMYAEPGEGEAVWLTFDPKDTSRKNQAMAFRFLDQSGIFPPEEKTNPAKFDEDYKSAVANFQQMTSGGQWSGVMDQVTLDKLWKQVIASNIALHNRNVGAGKKNADWAKIQAKIFAEDAGAGISVAGRAGHRQANLVGKRSGHRQANLVGGVDVIRAARRAIDRVLR